MLFSTGKWTRRSALLAITGFMSLPCFGQTAPPSAPSIIPNGQPNAGRDGRIDGLVKSANQASANRDYSSCAQLLEQVVAIDPKTPNALNFLGWTYNAMGQYAKAEPVLRKAIDENPRDPLAYNNLGQALAGQKKYSEAIEQYQHQLQVRPRDPWAQANMGRVYMLMKEYDKAIAALEDAEMISPDDPGVHFNLGQAFAKVKRYDDATQAYEKSVELQPVPFRWNSVAYVMAENKLDLQQAEKYSEAAIAATVNQMRNTSIDNLTREDAQLAGRIAAYWDTWGWIRYQENNLAEAEKYVKIAWLIAGSPTIADHLGDIYEKQGKTKEAREMWEMALLNEKSDPDFRGKVEAKLGLGKDQHVDLEEARKLMREARTITISNSLHLEGIGEFWVLLTPGPAVRGVKFASGDDEFRPYEKVLSGVTYPDSFPEATAILLLRRVRLTCMAAEPNCRLLMLSSQNTSTEELAVTTPSVAGYTGRLSVGASAQAAKLITRVQPEYPMMARQQGVSGIVTLRAIIGEDGSVKDLSVVSGDSMLAGAALNAVKKWKYQPTMVNGKPVEVTTEIQVIFQLRAN